MTWIRYQSLQALIAFRDAAPEWRRIRTHLVIRRCFLGSMDLSKDVFKYDVDIHQWKFFQYGNDFKNQGASFDFEGRKQGCIFCICISKSQRGQTKAALFSSSEFTHTVLLCGEVGIYIHLQEASPRVHFVKQQLRSPFMLSGHLGNAKLKDKNHAPPHSVCLGAPKPKLSHFFKVLQASPLQT